MKTGIQEQGRKTTEDKDTSLKVVSISWCLQARALWLSAERHMAPVWRLQGKGVPVNWSRAAAGLRVPAALCRPQRPSRGVLGGHDSRIGSTFVGSHGKQLILQPREGGRGASSLLASAGNLTLSRAGRTPQAAFEPTQ